MNVLETNKKSPIQFYFPYSCMIKILISELQQREDNFAKMRELTTKNDEIRDHVAFLVSQTNLRGLIVGKLGKTADFDPEVDEFEIIGYEKSEDAKQVRFKVSVKKNEMDLGRARATMLDVRLTDWIDL
jgi:hypothetical protein